MIDTENILFYQELQRGENKGEEKARKVYKYKIISLSGRTVNSLLIKQNH